VHASVRVVYKLPCRSYLEVSCCIFDHDALPFESQPAMITPYVFLIWHGLKAYRKYHMFSPPCAHVRMRALKGLASHSKKVYGIGGILS
jgi:hypothetical protein